jgi:hypothetical protein
MFSKLADMERMEMSPGQFGPRVTDGKHAIDLQQQKKSNRSGVRVALVTITMALVIFYSYMWHNMSRDTLSPSILEEGVGTNSTV